MLELIAFTTMTRVPKTEIKNLSFCVIRYKSLPGLIIHIKQLLLFLTTNTSYALLEPTSGKMYSMYTSQNYRDIMSNPF